MRRDGGFFFLATETRDSGFNLDKERHSDNKQQRAEEQAAI